MENIKKIKFFLLLIILGACISIFLNIYMLYVISCVQNEIQQQLEEEIEARLPRNIKGSINKLKKMSSAFQDLVNIKKEIYKSVGKVDDIYNKNQQVLESINKISIFLKDNPELLNLFLNSLFQGEKTMNTLYALLCPKCHKLSICDVVYKICPICGNKVNDKDILVLKFKRCQHCFHVTWIPQEDKKNYCPNCQKQR